MEPVTLCVWQGLVYVEVVRENGTCYPVCVAGAGVCGGGKREWNLLPRVCGRGWCMWRWQERMESVTLCVWQGMVYVEVVSENGTCYPVCVAGVGVCGGGKREWNLLSCVCGRGWCM